MNRNTKFAIDYHNNTKHSRFSIISSISPLDWDNKPFPFKIYTKLPKIKLNKDFTDTKDDTLEALVQINLSKHSNITVNKNLLSYLLFFSGGITRYLKFGSNEYFMRAASATGALYPIEIYIICQKLDDLESGIYHFCPRTFTLSSLRSGNFRKFLYESTGNNKLVLNSPVIFAFTSIAWRNSWKYKNRSYRHWFWDLGVILANLISICSSLGIKTQITTGFIDDSIDMLLCLKKHQEATLALIPLDIQQTYKEENIDSIVSPITHEIMPISKYEINYEDIWKIHDSSKLTNSTDVKNWINSTLTKRKIRLQKNINPSVFIGTNLYNVNSLSIYDTILLRGSSRKFARQPIPLPKLFNILITCTKNNNFDFVVSNNDYLNEIYFISHSVEGLPNGGYYYDKLNHQIKKIKTETSREYTGYLCLDQSLFSDSSVVFFILSDLDRILKIFGNRGYRIAQLDAGIIAGKIYLSSYSQGLGASGSTFYDDDVIDFFLPHSKNKSVMIAIGVGIPSYISKKGTIFASDLIPNQF